MSTVLSRQAAGVAMPVAMVVGSMILFQLAAGLSRPLVAEMGALGVSWMRMAAAAAVLLAFTRPRLRGIDRWGVVAALMLGSALATMAVGYVAAVNLLPLGLAATIVFLGPLSVAVLSSRGWQTMLLAVLAGAGVFLSLDVWSENAASGWAVDPLGLFYAGIAAAGFAGYILTSRRVGRVFQGSDGLAISVLAAAILLTPVGVGSMDSAPSAVLVLGACGLAVLSPLLTCWLEMAALRKLGTQVFSVLLSLEPAVAAILGILLLMEMPNEIQTLGLACVVIASIAIVRLRSDPA